MKTLYFDCGMGAAGDMLQGALVSLLSEEEQESFINGINNIGVEGVEVLIKDDVKCGITGKHVYVLVNGEEEHSEDVHNHVHGEHDLDNHDAEHHHDHSHDHHHDHHDEEHHGHSHHHASMAEIENIITNLKVSEKVKTDALAVYEMIAKAESKAHGKSVTEIHFHEVGMKDAIVDIVGTAMLMEILTEKYSVDSVVASPINVGFGKVKCAHGILPVPAPATADIIAGIPTYAGLFEGEMCTPTGAALIKHYADCYGNQPLMIVEKTGYGCGNKDFPAANVVKAVIGEKFGGKSSGLKDSVVELSCNIDDMTGETLAYAMEKLMENGAKDVSLTPIIMKKGRSGHVLTAICDENNKEEIAGLIFKHTSTIGIREKVIERMILQRDEKLVNTEHGKVRIKESAGYGVKKKKAEFDDLRAISERTGLSIDEVRGNVVF